MTVAASRTRAALPRAKKPAGVPAAYWFSVPQAAAAFGMTRRMYYKRVHPLLPAAAVKRSRSGGEALVHLRAAIDAWVESKLPDETKTPAESLADLRRQRDELRVRQSAVQVESAELRLAKERGQLVPQEDILTTYTLLGAGLKGAAERLEARFGKAAADELRGTLDDLEQRLIPRLRGGQEDQN